MEARYDLNGDSGRFGKDNQVWLLDYTCHTSFRTKTKVIYLGRLEPDPSYCCSCNDMGKTLYLNLAENVFSTLDGLPELRSALFVQVSSSAEKYYFPHLLAKLTNKVINDNVDELFEELRPVIEQVMTKIIEDLLFKGIESQVPFDKLYPPIH